jgi:hypothetical protein
VSNNLDTQNIFQLYFKISIFESSQHFRDICNGKVDKGRITLMKDLSLAKTGAVGERLYNKIQDFMWNDTLYDYISLPEVKKLEP